MNKFILTLCVLLLSIHSLLAQVPPPPDNHENSGPGGSATPIDQHIFILFGLAIVAGVYFILNKRKAYN